MTEIIIDLNGDDEVIAKNILNEIKRVYDVVSDWVVKENYPVGPRKMPVWVWAGEEAPEVSLPEAGFQKDMMVKQRLILEEKAKEQKGKNPWTCKTYFFMYMARVFKSFFENNGKGDKYLEIMKTVIEKPDGNFELSIEDKGDYFGDITNEQGNWWDKFFDFYISLNEQLDNIKLGTTKEDLKIISAPKDKFDPTLHIVPPFPKLKYKIISNAYKEFTPFKLVKAADAGAGAAAAGAEAGAAAAGAEAGAAAAGADAGGADEGGRRRRRKRRKSRKKKSKKSKRKSKKRKTKRKRKKRKSRKRRR